uniref:Uncharacterized protein n=1 Tax=Arundo donax TaxID=35708 RepID=A0A0A9F8D8_ARUDO
MEITVICRIISVRELQEPRELHVSTHKECTSVHSFLEKSPPKLNPPLPPSSPAAAFLPTVPAFLAGAAAAAFPSTLLRMGSVSRSCSSLYSAPKMVSNSPFSSAFATTAFVAAGTRAVDGCAAARRLDRRHPAGDAAAGATLPKPIDAMATIDVCVYVACVGTAYTGQ